MSVEQGLNREATDPGYRAAKERVTVSREHARAAFERIMGVRMESVSGRVDWPGAMLAAVPFQEQAARELGEELQTYARLRDTVAGTTIAFCNAFDWGEYELAKCIADEAFGDPEAIARLDLRPFSSEDSMRALLSSTAAATWGVEGSSMLARALQRRSGVLLLENFDHASEPVRELFSQGAASGSVTDLQGRKLSFRTFTTLFLLSGESRPALGLRPATHRSAADYGDAEITVSLDRPVIADGPEALLSPLLDELSSEFGVRVGLSHEAVRHVATMPVDRGLRRYRDQVRRLITIAALAGPDLSRRRRLTVRVSDGELRAR